VRILFCHCARSRAIPARTSGAVLKALTAAGLDVVAVDDLCGLAADRSPLLRDLAAAPDTVIVACHPRAVRWLFRAVIARDLPPQVRLLDMRTQTAREIRAALAPAAATRRGPAAKAAAAIAGSGDAWIPWFPVIDYSRCRNCRQCASFCLFGVYDANTAGRVEVRRPRQCKNHCPACARICPEVAIIFPKHDEAPINGAEVTDEAKEQARIAADVRQLLGDNPRAALAARQARRRQLLSPQAIRALAERDAAGRARARIAAWP
jgi:Pyruvate/2-oxoacid:ferredoxin oxidoreductase delta subunit